jgi:hypothetical protein
VTFFIESVREENFPWILDRVDSVGGKWG